ncbi:MAG: hypothetical protein WCP77_19210 [Roseococcus sp.]
MPDDEIARDLRRYATELVSGPPIKGLPRTRHFSGDREHEEQEVAQLIIKHLGYSITAMKSEPGGAGTIPDIEFIRSNGKRIGIEVTELVDQEQRQRRILRRKEEHRLGLTQQEAFLEEMKGKNPTPGHESRLNTVYWDISKTRDEIIKLITKKDQKFKENHQKCANFDQYDELVLAIFAGEEVDLKTITRLQSEWDAFSRHFHRVFVVLDYLPQTQDYPVVELRAELDKGFADLAAGQTKPLDLDRILTKGANE